MLREIVCEHASNSPSNMTSGNIFKGLVARTPQSTFRNGNCSMNVTDVNKNDHIDIMDGIVFSNCNDVIRKIANSPRLL